MAVRLVRLPRGCSAATSTVGHWKSVVKRDAAMTGCTYRSLYSCEACKDCRYDRAHTRRHSNAHGYERGLP